MNRLKVQLQQNRDELYAARYTRNLDTEEHRKHINELQELVYTLEHRLDEATDEYYLTPTGLADLANKLKIAKDQHIKYGYANNKQEIITLEKKLADRVAERHNRIEALKKEKGLEELIDQQMLYDTHQIKNEHADGWKTFEGLKPAEELFQPITTNSELSSKVNSASSETITQAIEEYNRFNQEQLKQTQERIDKCFKETSRWASKLNLKELQSIRWYTHDGSFFLNRQILQDSGQPITMDILINTTETEYEINEHKKHIDQAIEKASRKKPITVYRGMSEGATVGFLQLPPYYFDENYLTEKGLINEDNKNVPHNQNLIKDLTKRVKEVADANNGYLHFKTYSSASTSIKQANDFQESGILFQIVAKKAAPLAGISRAPQEEEYLLPRDSKYRVEGYETVIQGDKETLIINLVQEGD